MDGFRPWGFVLEKASWVRGFMCLAVVAFAASAMAFSQAQIGNGLPYPPNQPGVIPMNRTANPTADANRLMLDSMKHQDLMKEFEEWNVKRHDEMTSDLAILLQVANQLKAETDARMVTEKKARDAAAVTEIRQAEMIEKLAHNIQHKMRATIVTSN